MSNTLADRILGFNSKLEFNGTLPAGVRILNPYRDDPEVMRISEAFYRKFYSDNRPRRLILGINPGRLGAGATGIPFTDSKRLEDPCGIDPGGLVTHEPSSVFVYRVIAAMGGPENFFGRFFIQSVCPLGFVRLNAKGNWVNCNYYDFPALQEAVTPFILANLKALSELGMETVTGIALGKKNGACLREFNRASGTFGGITDLDHPRYIAQYKARQADLFVDKYREILSV